MLGGRLNGERREIDGMSGVGVGAAGGGWSSAAMPEVRIHAPYHRVRRL